MGALDTLMSLDAAALVNTDEFGETVTFTTRTGTTRSIKAVILRQSPVALMGGPAQKPALEAWVRNSATLGISASEINCQGDTITVAERHGGTAVAHLIREVMESDAAMLHLRLD